MSTVEVKVRLDGCRRLKLIYERYSPAPQYRTLTIRAYGDGSEIEAPVKADGLDLATPCAVSREAGAQLTVSWPDSFEKGGYRYTFIRYEVR